MTDDLEESSDSGVGRLFEDFRPGEVIYHPFGKTVTEADNHAFTLMTQNVAKIHVDRNFAAASEFGRPLVAASDVHYLSNWYSPEGPEDKVLLAQQLTDLFLVAIKA